MLDLRTETGNVIKKSKGRKLAVYYGSSNLMLFFFELNILLSKLKKESAWFVSRVYLAIDLASKKLLKVEGQYLPNTLTAKCKMLINFGSKSNDCKNLACPYFSNQNLPGSNIMSGKWPSRVVHTRHIKTSVDSHFCELCSV